MSSAAKIAYTYDALTGAYLGEATADADPLIEGHWLYPAHATAIAPPATDATHMACFATEKGPWRVRRYWGSTALYCVKTGAPYQLNTDLAGQTFNGLGALPDWLTDCARPTEDHVWRNGQWVLDRESEKARLAAEVAAEQSKRMQHAEFITTGLRDAYLAGLLSKAEKHHYQAWAEYKWALLAIGQQDGFPYTVQWPEAPKAPQETKPEPGPEPDPELLPPSAPVPKPNPKPKPDPEPEPPGRHLPPPDDPSRCLAHR